MKDFIPVKVDKKFLLKYIHQLFEEGDGVFDDVDKGGYDYFKFVENFDVEFMKMLKVVEKKAREES